MNTSKHESEYDVMIKEIEDVVSKWSYYITNKELSYIDYYSQPRYGYKINPPKVKQIFEIKLERII